MEGRWTICVGHDGHSVVLGSLERMSQVPVVPCNDAAIERAVAGAEAEWDRIAEAETVDDERKDNETPQTFLLRKAMEAGFRAAGETP